MKKIPSANDIAGPKEHCRAEGALHPALNGARRDRPTDEACHGWAMALQPVATAPLAGPSTTATAIDAAIR